MTTDKRSVATDALDTLGTHPIPTDSGRDAIHLAVEPVVALETLLPGQHIGFVEGCASSKAEKKLGIVDPFLSGPVSVGDEFWLVVYPRQITSLRHVWTHPDFEEEERGGGTADRDSEADKKARSEAWLRDFIAKSDCPDYHTVIGAALRGDGFDEEHLHFDGSDAHGEIPDEFWDHVEIVTGKKPPHRAKYFSCAC